MNEGVVPFFVGPVLNRSRRAASCEVNSFFFFTSFWGERTRELHMGGEIVFVLFGIAEPTSPKKSTDSDKFDLHLGGSFFSSKKNDLTDIWPLKVSIHFF